MHVSTLLVRSFYDT